MSPRRCVCDKFDDQCFARPLDDSTSLVLNKRKQEQLETKSHDGKRIKFKSEDEMETTPCTSSSCSHEDTTTLDAAATTTDNQVPDEDEASHTNQPPPPGLEDWIKTFAEWNNNDRLAALNALVTGDICNLSQMRYLLSIVEPQLQRDFISLLPKELSLYVLSFLDPWDLLRAAQTCRYWHILCEDNLLWREKCREEGILNESDSLSDLFRSRLGKNLNKQSDWSTGTSLIERSECKRNFMRHKEIEFNWRYGILQYENGEDPNPPAAVSNQEEAAAAAADVEMTDKGDTTSSNEEARLKDKLQRPRQLKKIKVLKGHDDHVITCLQFNHDSGIIVSGSDDNTLKVWCSQSGRCLRTLFGHTGGVWSSQLSPENIVVSGSTDRTLRIWDAMSGKCLHTLFGHTSTVRCMALYNGQVVSGSRDATLRVWNIHTGRCEHVLVGHLAAVRCVQFNGVNVVSGAYDFQVKIWDMVNETCMHTLEGHTNRVYSLQYDGKHIVSGSLDTSIRVWNAETGELKHTLVGHQSLTSGMQLRNNILVSGNADSTVKVWDISTGRCLQTLSGKNKHQSAVTCLLFNSKFVVTSSDDGTVKLWDLKTGEFIRNLINLHSGGSGGVVWRIRASNTKLVCAVGSRNGTEETKLFVLDFDRPEEMGPPKGTF